MAPQAAEENRFRHNRGTVLLREKFCPKVAVSAAMRMSAASAIFIPAPAAAPFTAAITGCGMRRIFRTACIPERRIGPSSAVSLRSRPLPMARQIAARAESAACAA